MEIIPRFELEFRHKENDKEAMEEILTSALAYPIIPKGFNFQGATTQDFTKEIGYFITKIHFGKTDSFEKKIPPPPKRVPPQATILG